jgi:hypothetical protein
MRSPNILAVSFIWSILSAEVRLNYNIEGVVDLMVCSVKLARKEAFSFQEPLDSKPFRFTTADPLPAISDARIS